jgi:rubrerythrin
MDPVHFSSKEILEMAVRIEENGLGFYKAASASTESQQIKELFDYFIIEEVKHVELFEALKEAITDGVPSDYNDPYLAEESLYINALADSSIFTEGDDGIKLAKSIKGDDEAIDFAIQIEKDSILFYLELINMVRDDDRATVKTILSEERKHIAKLTELKLNMQS